MSGRANTLIIMIINLKTRSTTIDLESYLFTLYSNYISDISSVHVPDNSVVTVIEKYLFKIWLYLHHNHVSGTLSLMKFTWKLPYFKWIYYANYKFIYFFYIVTDNFYLLVKVYWFMTGWL